MHELSQFLKTKEKKQMRIPVPPEVPEFLRRCRTSIPVCPCSCFQAAQNQDNRRYQCLHAEQLHGMSKIFRKHGNQRARCRQVSQRHPFECAARRPSRGHFPGAQRRDSLLLRFETCRTLLTPRGIHFCAPSERRVISSVVLSLPLIHSAFSGLTKSIRQCLCKQNYAIALRHLSSLRLFRALCVSALGFLFLPNPEPATLASALCSQGLSTDSPLPAGQPPPSTTDHSSCRHTRRIAPGRAASPSPRVSLRALSLPQTSTRLRPVPSTCCPFPPAASQTRES